VALNSDASVKRLKGPTRPAQSETARAEVMAAIRGVDAVIIFDQDTPLELIAELQPDVLVKGADYAEDQIIGADIVKARGGRIVRAELSPGQSTTRILAQPNDPKAAKTS
jgi:D-beta-D-heptose 7-phosphate kinase / D-beta-D-heptose 1-phosphate adenosyltransferase